MHVEELETYLDKIDGNLLVLFNIVVATLNYIGNFILMSKLWASLQILLNKLHVFFVIFFDVKFNYDQNYDCGSKQKEIQSRGFLLR